MYFSKFTFYKCGTIGISFFYISACLWFLVDEGFLCLGKCEIKKNVIPDIIYAIFLLFSSIFLLIGAIKEVASVLLPWFLINVSMLFGLIFQSMVMMYNGSYKHNTSEHLITLLSFCFCVAMFYKEIKKKEAILEQTTLNRNAVVSAIIPNRPPPYEEADKFLLSNP